MAFWDTVSVPIGVETSLRNIFSGVIIGGLEGDDPDTASIKKQKQEVVKSSLAEFRGYFPYNIFSNNYAVFYEVITDFRMTVFNKHQLRSLVENNRDIILDSPYINKSRYAMTTNGNMASDDDILNAILSSIEDDLADLSKNVITSMEFESACRSYITWYKSAFAEYTAANMTAIMSSIGFDDRQPGKRTRHYQGLEDMQLYYNKNMSILKALDDDGRIKSTTIDEEWLESDLETADQKSSETEMFATGLSEIDGVVGKLRRGHMIGIMGPPKGGKTRFTNYLVSLALRAGYNVCVWPLEGTKEDWLAMQTACLIAGDSHSKYRDTSKIFRVSSNDIERNNFGNNPKFRKLVNSAKTALATNPNVGKLSFIEGIAYCEDFLDVLTTHYETENQFDVLVIDPLINIQTKTGINKVERISTAYKTLLNYINHSLKKKVLALIPAQLTQKYVDYLRTNPDATMDVTAGGESSETERTPDLVIGLFSSKEERDNNMMKIYSVASRHNGDFHDFYAKCYLECCYFMDSE